MAVYLQFDSSARSNAYIQRNINNVNVWVPNDNYSNDNESSQGFQQPYQQNSNQVQSPTNYRVLYRELNDANNIRTLGFLAHCKERPTNLTFSVENCVVTLPSNALIPRETASGVVNYVSIIDEPYLYVRMMPIGHSEGNLICSNNPPASDATFIIWCDKIQGGTDGTPAIIDPIPRPNPNLLLADIDTTRWVIYKTCMITVMRLDLEAEEWMIRIYDRFGNDVVLGESDNSGAGFNQDTPPQIDPDLQTNILVGIKPNYPV